MAVGALIGTLVAGGVAAGANQYRRNATHRAEDKAFKEQIVRTRDAEDRARQNAIDSKRGLFAKQESQRAEGGGAPVKKTYLGSRGASGGYIDEEAIKAKKRLGGSK